MAPPLWFVGLQEMGRHILADCLAGRCRRESARPKRGPRGSTPRRTLFPGPRSRPSSSSRPSPCRRCCSLPGTTGAWCRRRPPRPGRLDPARHRRGSACGHPPARNTGELLLHAADAAAQRAAPADARRVARVRADGSVFAVAVGSATARRRRADDGRRFAVQPVLLTALLIGFPPRGARARRLAANWAVQVAWAGDTAAHRGRQGRGRAALRRGPRARAAAVLRGRLQPADALAIALCGSPER